MRDIFLAIGCAATLLATLYAKWLSVEHDVQGKIALILVDVQRDFMDDGPGETLDNQRDPGVLHSLTYNLILPLSVYRTFSSLHT